MARRSPTGRFPALRQGRRRESRWLASTWTSDTIATDAAVIVTLLDAGALALLPFTVVRTRGFMHIATDQAGTTEDQSVIYGNIVVKEEASTVGITAVPTPELESDSDWHLFEPLTTRFQLNSAIGFVHPAGVGKEFDSKAMRKVDVGSQLLGVAEVGASGLSEGLILRVFVRILIKLH